MWKEIGIGALILFCIFSLYYIVFIPKFRDVYKLIYEKKYEEAKKILNKMYKNCTKKMYLRINLNLLIIYIIMNDKDGINKIIINREFMNKERILYDSWMTIHCYINDLIEEGKMYFNNFILDYEVLNLKEKKKFSNTYNFL